MTLQLITQPFGLGFGIASEHAETRPWWYEHVVRNVPGNWWHNWNYKKTPISSNRVLMIWSTKDEEYFNGGIAAAQENPNAIILVENEPEQECQSNTDAVTCAKRMNRFVKETSNPWAGLGNFWATPYTNTGYSTLTAIKYCDEYLEAGGAIPDYWSMDIYPWDEDPVKDTTSLLKKQNEWMVSRGVVRDRIIKEVCWLRDNVYLQRILMNHLVKIIREKEILGAAWFQSGGSEVFSWAALLDDDGAKTEVGKQWDKVFAIESQSDNSIWLPTIYT